MSDKSYYKLLQVDPSADADVIAAAHRVLARRLHPETDFTGIDEYRAKELERALRVLSDPDQRRAGQLAWRPSSRRSPLPTATITAWSVRG